MVPARGRVRFSRRRGARMICAASGVPTQPFAGPAGRARPARSLKRRNPTMSRTPGTAATPAAAAAQPKPKGDDADLQAVERLKAAHAAIKKELAKVIVGQDKVIDEILISIF